jgi:hypothetical protein
MESHTKRRKWRGGKSPDEKTVGLRTMTGCPTTYLLSSTSKSGFIIRLERPEEKHVQVGQGPTKSGRLGIQT